MPVEIEEAYDREHEFPAFLLLYHAAYWRDPGLWWFDLVAHWPSGRTYTDSWPIHTKAGAGYVVARERLRRRAAAIGYRKVTLYHRHPPPTAEEIADIEKANRKLKQAREERKRVEAVKR